jgi:hypothetical protein
MMRGQESTRLREVRYGDGAIMQTTRVNAPALSQLAAAVGGSCAGALVLLHIALLWSPWPSGIDDGKPFMFVLLPGLGFMLGMCTAWTWIAKKNPPPEFIQAVTGGFLILMWPGAWLSLSIAIVMSAHELLNWRGGVSKQAMWMDAMVMGVFLICILIDNCHSRCRMISWLPSFTRATVSLPVGSLILASAYITSASFLLVKIARVKWA